MNFFILNKVLWTFQDSASPIMVGILNFHHYIFFYLIGIFLVVFWMFYFIIDTYLYIQKFADINKDENQMYDDDDDEEFYQLIDRYHLNQMIKNLSHNTFIEIIWTFIPAIILILIAIPSLSLLYAMDEPYDVKFTALITGFQWYWAYMIPAMYTVFINIDNKKVFTFLLNEYFLIYNKNKLYLKNFQFINKLVELNNKNYSIQFLKYNQNQINLLNKTINTKLIIPINLDYSLLIGIDPTFLSNFKNNYSDKFYNFINNETFYQKKSNLILNDQNFYSKLKFKFKVEIVKFFYNYSLILQNLNYFFAKAFFWHGVNNLDNYLSQNFSKLKIFKYFDFTNNDYFLGNFIHNYDYRLFLNDFGNHQQINYLNILKYCKKINFNLNYYITYNNKNVFFPKKINNNDLFKKFILNPSFFSKNYQININLIDLINIQNLKIDKLKSANLENNLIKIKLNNAIISKINLLSFCLQKNHNYLAQLNTLKFSIKNNINIINNYNNFNFIINSNLENLNNNLSHFKINKSIYLQKFDSYLLQGDDLKVGFHRNLEVTRALNLPLKTHIRLHITSMDVLHSWAVPSLGIKVDAVPGRINQALLYLERRGTFYGQCSELCGANHGFMPIAVKSIDAKKFWQN